MLCELYLLINALEKKSGLCI